MFQLPENVQNEIYKTFLFEKFVTDFSMKGTYFKFEKYAIINGVRQINKTDPYYSWEDQSYRDFMMGVLYLLEPRYEKKDELIYRTVSII